MCVRVYKVPNIICDNVNYPLYEYDSIVSTSTLFVPNNKYKNPNKNKGLFLSSCHNTRNLHVERSSTQTTPQPTDIQSYRHTHAHKCVPKHNKTWPIASFKANFR